MSALTPHIRVLRALADAADAGAFQRAKEGHGPESRALEDLAGMHRMAADQLEREEAELTATVEPQPGDPKFNPKGRGK